MLQIDSQHKGPHILLIAGVHGDEYEPMIAVMELYNQLKRILVKGKVTLVTGASETAYAAGTRTGADGLDLARICPGNTNGSVSEVAAFRLSEWIRACDGVVDLHTGGALFDIYPLSGYMLHHQPEVLETQRRMAAAFNLPLVWGTDARAGGRTLSVARDAGIPAIYAEYGGGNMVQASIIAAYVQGCLGVLDHFKMLVDGAFSKAPVAVKHTVEDAEPESGFLQGKMQSAFDGIFVPAVQVGAMVKKGAEWGCIFDPVRQEKYPVFADRSGLVLFVRRHPRVSAGESLGGILAMDP